MRKIEKRTEIFEQMLVRRAVVSQIVPAIASQMIALIYNLADTYFVGMLNDPGQTAAVTVVSASFVMLTAISNLFGVGGASLIARYLGRREEEKARRVAAVSIWGGAVSALLFSLLFFAFSEPVLYLCGATERTYPIAREYAVWVIIIGGPATILNTLLANLVRAEGNASGASIGVSLGGVLNTILDPLFVLPGFLGFGAVGAGMATALSNAAGLIYFIVYMMRRRGVTVISPEVRYLRDTAFHVREILSIGFPSAVQYALTVVAVSAQMNFVSGYDTEAVAALGIVKKLDQLPLYFSIGTANGLLPLLAYNHGAGNHWRRREAFWFGSMISLGFSLACVAAYEIFAPALVGLFIEDSLTRTYGAAFLRIMVTAMPMMSLCYPMIIQFQALGRVKESLICSVLRKGVLDIPLLFLMDSLLPLYGCMMVQPMVDSISLVFCLVFYRRINRETNTQTESVFRRMN